MGNCMFSGGLGAAEDALIRVVTSSGGVMELHPPVTAECITNGFPGHGIFRSGGDDDGRRRSPPLPHNEELLGGEVYHLRPLGATRAGHASIVASYRVSFDHHGLWKRQDQHEAVPRSSATAGGVSGHFGGGGGGDGGGGGMWTVKLLISPAKLVDILSHESRTEALIESVRTVAKCGKGAAASVANSDQWSLTNSRKAQSEAWPSAPAAFPLNN